MFQIKFSTEPEPASILIDDGYPTIGPGVRVVVDTVCYGQQVGTIDRITLSPYYPECNEGVQRAYVIGDGWSDYILVDDLFLESDAHYCSDCERYVSITLGCPECGSCLSCCDCVTENADDLEDTDYQPPRFLWMGRWFPG